MSSQSPEIGPIQDNRRILLSCFCADIVAGAASQLLGAILPQLRESYGLSYETAGLLLSAQSMGTMTANLAFGFLPLWLGRKASVLSLTCWLTVACLLLLLGVNPALLLAAGFMIGLSRGGTVNFGNVMVGVYGQNKLRALSLLHACFALGALGSPLLAMAFSRAGRWQGAVAVMGVMGAALFLIFLTFPVSGKTERGKSAGGYPWLTSGKFWLAGLILMVYIGAEYGISGWLVTYFKESGLLSGSVAQVMGGLLWGSVLVGRLGFAAAGKRFTQQQLLVTGGVGFFVFLVFLLNVTHTWAIVLGVVGFGLFMAGIYPSTIAGVNRELGGSELAMSVLVTMGGLGGTVMPGVMGYVSQRAGVSGGMSLLIVVTGVMLGLILINLRER